VRVPWRVSQAFGSPASREREGKARWHDLPTFTAALDRRLRPDAAAPLAVGFSGGGDSLALLILTLDWARAHGRPWSA
jgi:3'-phosphoadenosine 5'-phosphosulfate sulfotransferase (PAPS reductase)/FAD synthetase